MRSSRTEIAAPSPAGGTPTSRFRSRRSRWGVSGPASAPLVVVDDAEIAVGTSEIVRRASPMFTPVSFRCVAFTRLLRAGTVHQRAIGGRRDDMCAVDRMTPADAASASSTDRRAEAGDRGGPLLAGQRDEVVVPHALEDVELLRIGRRVEQRF